MRRRLLVLLGFILAIGTLLVVYRNHFTIERMIAEEANLRDSIAAHPVLGFFVGFAIYCATCFIPGTTGKSLVLGWLFGFWQSLIQVNLALTLVAMATFGLSRYVFRDAVRSRAGASLLRIDDAIRREGAFYLFALRVLHSPYSVVNYIMGATSITAVGFWWSTQLGLLPGNIVFVYAGTQLPSIKKLSEEGWTSFITPGMLVVFVALSVVPLILRSVVRRMVPGASSSDAKD